MSDFFELFEMKLVQANLDETGYSKIQSIHKEVNPLIFMVLFAKQINWQFLILVCVILKLLGSNIMVHSVSIRQIRVVRSDALSLFRRDLKKNCKFCFHKL